ncbi:MAG: PHA/PHB synthase family protein, partial [Pseudomonadota bacterium]
QGLLRSNAALSSEETAKLHKEFMERHARLWAAMLQRKPGEPSPALALPDPGDRRFAAPEWSRSPFYDYLRQAYLINADFLRRLAETLPVEDGAAKSRVRFLTRQYVDALAPSNFVATNPEFVKIALETKGASITEGIRNMIADLEKGRISMTDDKAFELGRNLAVTPGQVIFENEVMQLIQYAPLTDRVAERPLLIIPPCINKYYVLDLQPENSVVRYLLEQGQTVFLASWRNPGPEQGHLTWDDYLEQGVLTALRVTREVVGLERINLLGYCIGGTLLASALAVAQARGEDAVESLSLFTTLLDFSDTGEIGYFIDEASVAAREAAIGKGGLLLGSELAAVFRSLRPNELIWNYVVDNYLKGRQPAPFDILNWNLDNTNLPGPFLCYYLRHMYLNNSLRVPGKLEMCGTRVDLTRLQMPAYILATREDHIVPWRTAYLSRQVLGGESTFVLGASGHIAGVINPAAKNRRSYWTNGASVADSQEWLAGATENKGSWWPHWIAWLRQFGGKQRAARKRLGGKGYKPLEPAPGRYVKERA